ncbi:hypothetical protein RhiirA5_395320 [Rhizophagus irregularis]|uniref:DUF7729 domain-containing protein n=2 Tax=Rhizophagus irregularis TaxID=588596 RepID=A0A2I1E2D0_9GLOM|nr:hypothetical protein GLOIN_2v1576911 [Rhizophagus irregularis DAOM 181602=DAOM 197198]PKC14952.1 hypothetical protein RhiirA5_395320 [Rhizophagus irregularis]PKC75542.1 hypothetical protein RhiirA1_528748 [Rhizophagus irregularis]PKK79859.1 hypothetical protein RhiirC2_842271 [Rhizophagus irregularis]PKY16293.1 hypothetical protein RhiirB3_521053 [Rhizophagus irregularis]POG74423.1 hypothetical protein GLOIN_2v1576911 [Rhizophagus irregularis DAOM 181602=DAOM 197198]|eukprot:XP_025181289.1 hypothetical protein GLOIN_2v1576911 [Rhizophagus irregularis DAOM 181602=DAOM 197198]
MKVTLFITTFLAAASLGLALPQSPPTPSNVTAHSTSKGLPQIEQILADVPGGVLGDLSQKCQSALLGLVTDPKFLKCIPIASLVPLLPLVTDPSIIKNFIADPVKNFPPLETPLQAFSTAFCPVPKCSDPDVAGAIKIIQDGCKEDLDKKNQFIVMVFDAAVFYSPIHDIMCFQFDKAFCWDESILTVIKLPPSPIKVTGDKLLDAVAVSDPSAVCTKCNKAIVNTFLNFITAKESDLARQILASFGIDQAKLDQLRTFVAVKCGINFEDGKIPK